MPSAGGAPYLVALRIGRIYDIAVCIGGNDYVSILIRRIYELAVFIYAEGIILLVTRLLCRCLGHILVIADTLLRYLGLLDDTLIRGHGLHDRALLIEVGILLYLG